MKVLLILIDGMRPESLAGVPEAQEMLKKSAYTLQAKTVMPSVTLPCHMSLFHSVDPARHGTTTNVYAPQVRPVQGLCEVLFANKKRSAFFYNWEQLRDIARPGILSYSLFFDGHSLGYEKANALVTDGAIRVLQDDPVDFAFFYLGLVDAVGHKQGWMGPDYQKAVQNSWESIRRVLDILPQDYTVIITADHGGHDRIHGTDLPEDTTIPLLIMGEGVEAGKNLDGASILDIAPTVAKLLGAEPDEDWEGKSLL